jgi:hypothetical protein
MGLRTQMSFGLNCTPNNRKIFGFPWRAPFYSNVDLLWGGRREEFGVEFDAAIVQEARETAPLTPMQAFQRCSTTGSFLSCPTCFDFRSSSHGTR